MNKYFRLKKQKGGEDKEIDIIKFIASSSLNDIKDNLLKYLTNNKYCDDFLGRGLAGEVYVPGINSFATLKEVGIEVPIVIKKANKEGIFDIKIINKNLYIYSYENITTEALILLYTNKLWHKKVSPHLPLMLGYSTCGGGKYIHKIITERHGLPEK